jgi:hypothetical protein
MAYSSGRGLAFRPIGVVSNFSPPSDQVDRRGSFGPWVQERRLMAQQRYRINDQEFPALAPVGPLAQNRPPLIPEGPPPTFMDSQRRLLAPPRFSDGPQTVCFDPPRPPPATHWGHPAFRSFRGTDQSRPTQPTAFNFLVDKLFRYLQLSHHRRNWINLPKSLNSRVKDLELDIAPPLMDSILRGALADVTQAYKDSVKEAVLKHFDRHLLALTHTLKSLKPDDVERAGRWATTRLRQRLQGRFDKLRCRQDITSITQMVGTNFSISATNSNTITTENNAIVNKNTANLNLNTNSNVDNAVTNRVRSNSLNSAATSGNTRDTMEGVEPILFSPVRTSSQPTLQCKNRFNPLVDLSNDNISVSVSGSASKGTITASAPPPSRITRNSRQTPKVNITFVPKSPVFTDDDCSDDCSDEYAGLGKKTVINDKYNIACEITDDVKILIIGDSNLRKVDNLLLDKDWHVLCIPGANLEITTAVINGLPVDNKLTDIIITSGICDSNNDAPPISNCLTALNRLKVRKHFLGVSFDEEKLKEKQCTNIRHINNFAKDFKSVNFIPPLQRVHTGIDGIHYTDTSVTLIINKIITHLDSFLCQR